MDSRTVLLLCSILLIFLSVYSYMIYPVFLFCLSLFFKKRVKKSPIEPAVSFIITVHNGEGTIREKILNTLNLDYPPGKLQILVASDASTDNTESIVREFPEVVLSRSKERRGKEGAQRDSLPFATGEILVFTDVGTLVERDAIRKMMENFADPSVGSVSSCDKLLSSQSGNAEDLYIRYEMSLRRLESGIHGLVGLSGSFFAVRRDVCVDWSEDLCSDFNAVFLTVKKGLRAVSDDAVLGYYRDIQGGQSEFKRKVRTIVHGIYAFVHTPELLNVFEYGVFSWQLVSHKLMRWLAPLFLAGLLAMSVAGSFAGSFFCSILLILQGIFYGSAILGLVWKGSRKILPVKIAFYFSSVNAAALFAWIHYFRGERMRIWSPTVR